MKKTVLIIGNIFQVMIMFLFGFFLLQSIMLVEDIPNIEPFYNIDFQNDVIFRKLIILLLSVLVCLLCVLIYIQISLRLNFDKNE